MNLIKDTIVYILRLSSQLSNTDCINARLTTKYACYDAVIFAEFKSRLNKFVHHDLSTNIIKIDIPCWVLPSDEDIQKKIFRGVFDIVEHSDPITLSDYIFSTDENNIFKRLLYHEYPKTDFILYSEPDPETGEYVLDLNNWEFLNYPIVNISATYPMSNLWILFAAELVSLNSIRLILDNSDKQSKHIKVVESYELRGIEYVVYRPMKQLSVIEAIYFTGDIPAEFMIATADIKLTIKPTRKYTYLGMIKIGAIYDVNIILPKNTEFNLITWMFGQCLDEYNKMRSSTVFYDECHSVKTMITSGAFMEVFKQTNISSKLE